MIKLTRFIRKNFAKITRDRAGAVTVIAAVSFTAVAGFVGLGTEASYWYVMKRNLQGGADSGAFTAASAMIKGDTSSTITSNAAQAIANQYGMTDTNNPVTVTVNQPPTSGAYQGNSSAIEVIMSQSPPMLFSGLFLSHNPTIIGRAVGMIQTGSCNGSSCGCILALDKGNVIDVQDTGNAIVNIPGCSMYINSNDPNGALFMSGTATINAYSSYIVGRKLITGSAQLNHDPAGGTYENTPVPVADPYLNVPLPSFTGCNQTNYTVNAGETKTLDADGGVLVLCGGIKVSGNGILQLKSGTYIIYGGHNSNNDGFDISGSGTVTSTFGGVTYPVTIVLTGPTGNYATVNISGGANITLTAPTSGPLTGLAFYQDRNAPVVNSTNTATTTNSFSGGTTMNITGAIYFPNQLVNYTGGAAIGSASAASCTQLVAYTIKIGGATNFQHNNCSSIGTASFGYSVALVE